MKFSIGIHPDLPYPFSNAPESDEKPLDSPMVFQPATERHERGIAALGALLNHWLGRSGLSHEQVCQLASWGLGEAAIIDGAVISRVRNGRQQRGASWRHLDALAAANTAIWLWQACGQHEAWKQLGPHGGWGVRDEWLNTSYWLPHPENSGQPLRFHDFADVVAGYLELPYLLSSELSPAEARHASDALAALLEGIAAHSGWGPREAVQRLLALYPVADRARQQRLRALIVGDANWSRDELEAELQAVAELIRQVRGVDRYGPGELQQELLFARRSREQPSGQGAPGE